MALSQLQESLDKEIQQHFNPSIESCGFVIVQKGKLKYIPCENVSEDPKNYFIVDPKLYARYSLISDIVYIVHTHPDNTIPSEHDLTTCNALGIPYVIYNQEKLDHSITYPNNYKFLIGREYKFGIRDCFEAARDWYIAHSVYAPKRAEHWKDDWWLQDYDYINNEVSNWPFKKVKTLQYGDLLTFAVEHDKENHLAVYLDRDQMYHHAANRLSCTENMYPFWGKYLRNIYRYEKGNITRASWR